MADDQQGYLCKRYLANAYRVLLTRARQGLSCLSLTVTVMTLLDRHHTTMRLIHTSPHEASLTLNNVAPLQ